MKKSTLKKKVKQLVKQSLNAKEIERMVDKAVASGCIDLESAPDDWRLPKNFACALAKQLEWDYKPIKGNRRDNR